MKKILLLILCIATGLLGVKAENEAANGLIIEQKDGVSVGFLFADEPVMTYTATDIVLNGKDFNVSFPMANVAKMTFGDASDLCLPAVRVRVLFRDTALMLMVRSCSLPALCHQDSLFMEMARYTICKVPIHS